MLERSCTPRQCSAGTWQKRASFFLVDVESGCEDGACVCREGYYGKHGLCFPCENGWQDVEPDQTECEPCPQGTYQDELGSSQCKSCPPGRFCPAGSVNAASVCRPCSNATLATAHLEPGTWRLGPSTERIYPCLKVGDTTPCRGGGEAGALGGGYCVDGKILDY